MLCGSEMDFFTYKYVIGFTAKTRLSREDIARRSHDREVVVTFFFFNLMHL